MVSINSSATGSIERRECPSHEEWVREFLVPRSPVVITGALKSWQATSKWSLEYFKDRHGSMPLSIEGQNHTLAGFLPAREGGGSLTMGEFIDLVSSSSEENPAPYLRNVWIEKFLPELDADLQPAPPYFYPNWLEGPFTQPLYSRVHAGRPELYIGGRGGKFPVLHYDSWHMYTFLCQIYGVKEYTMFSPDQTPFLYPSDYHTSSISVNEIEDVDLETFPLFAKTNPIRFTLNPGEILFVPPGWWHMVKILTPSISISATRVSSPNWNDFVRDLLQSTPLHLKPFVWSYLTAFRFVRPRYRSDAPSTKG
jgi:histone arginine demethylase JMJD6